MKRYIFTHEQFGALKQSLTLSEIQKDVLVGSLLGDGCIQVSKNKKSARLQMRNCLKQREFLDWKYKYFQKWAPNGLKFDSANQSYWFETVFHDELLGWRDEFYPKGKKVIPNSIGELLTNSLSLAVWFLDDGNGYLKCDALRISSYAFRESGNKNLQKCLKQNFNLSTNLLHDCKGVQLYFPVQSAKQLYRLIWKYIPPTMEYKFARLNPVETTRRLPDMASGMKI